jgi:hypothetical protein
VSDRRTPGWVKVRLTATFVPEAIDGILAQPAPVRGGMDAWTWVENGHSWLEVVEGLEGVVRQEAP